MVGFGGATLDHYPIIWQRRACLWILQASPGQPDCLVLSPLPFAEDMRTARFAAFDEKPDLMPSAEQRQQMANLVNDLDLAGSRTLLLLQRSKLHSELLLPSWDLGAATVGRLSSDQSAITEAPLLKRIFTCRAWAPCSHCCSA